MHGGVVNEIAESFAGVQGWKNFVLLLMSGAYGGNRVACLPCLPYQQREQQRDS